MPDSPRSRDGPDGAGDDDADEVRVDARDDVVRADDDADWRYELADVGDDGGESAGRRPPLEPGSPSAENVFFVLVGVALTLLLLLSVFVPLPLMA